MSCAVARRCGLLPEEIDETKGWSAQKLYSEAKEELNDGNYEKAIKLYEKLEARYPYGRFAQQAQIEIAYAYYKDKDTASALAAADRFIKLHPNHPNVDYVYYLKRAGQFQRRPRPARFRQQPGHDRARPEGGARGVRRLQGTGDALSEQQVHARRDARMNYLVNALASHEVHVARYYMKRGAYVAAANRAQYALKTYPQAPANEEGLLIMVQGLRRAGHDGSAQRRRARDEEELSQQRVPEGRTARATPWWQIWNW